MADTTKTPDDENAPESQSAAEEVVESSAPLVTPPPAGDEDHTSSGKDQAPKKRSGLVRGLLVAAGIIIAGQAVILVSTGGWRDVLSPTSAEDKARLTTLEAKLAALEAADVEAAARDQSFADDMEARGSEIDALTNTIGEISASPANDLATTQAMISALETRIDSFEAQTGEIDPMLGAPDTSDTNPGQQVQGAGFAEVADMKDVLASLSERFAAMNQNLEAAGGRIEALEETAPPENLEEILGSIQGSIRPQSEIDALSARLAAIEEADPEGAARAAVLALSATELARAVATSRSFASELDAFLILAPDNSFAMDLRAYARQGAPMEKALLLEFEPAARAIAEAERLRAGDGLWTWIVNQFTSLFSIRKVGERDGDDWQAILARAENRIAIEDLGAAVKELSALSGPAAKGAAPWLARAQARARVDALVTGLTTQIFADLVSALEGEQR
jgi:hypothetical protein